MPELKKARLEEGKNEGANPEEKLDSQVLNLGQFKFQELLSEVPDRKIAFLHSKRVAEDEQETDAVIIVEKTAFAGPVLRDMFCKDSRLCLTAKNDIYRNMDLELPPNLNRLKATVIWPATQKHIDKYRDQDIFLVNESPEDYKNTTLPHIETSQFSVQWVYNILEHKAEADRIVFEDPDPETGFLIAPDLKWDGVTLENLYCTAIVMRRDLKSLRELTQLHLPLLENIMEKGTTALCDRYGAKASQLRIFVHYQPSYYHFHVHFTCLKYEAPGIQIGKGHLLAEIIDNLKRYPDFYQTATLQYALKANDKLYEKYKEAGRI